MLMQMGAGFLLTTNTVSYCVSNSSICYQNCHMLDERIISIKQLLSGQRNKLDKVRTLLSKLSAVPGIEGVRGSGMMRWRRPTTSLPKAQCSQTNVQKKTKSQNTNRPKPASLLSERP